MITDRVFSSRVSPDSYHSTLSLGDNHVRVFSLSRATEPFGGYRRSLILIRLEFPLTPSNMYFFSINENHFQTKVFVFNSGQPSEYINWTTLRVYQLDNPPTIDIVWTTLRCISYGQPSEYINWTILRRLILYGQPSDVYHMDNPPSISIGQPSEYINWKTLRRLIFYGQPSDKYHMDNPPSI